MWNILLYNTPNGSYPVAEFIEKLSPKLQAKALQDIELLKEYGNTLPMPYSRAMGNGLFELRISQSGNNARIFYFFQIGNHIVLTNGFIKKTQQTPIKELEKALKYKQEYESRELK